MTNHLVFDIETGPLPDEQLRKMIPEFTAPANFKDPDKIAASIKEQREKFTEKAALSALTGQVLAIGITRGGDQVMSVNQNETTSEQQIVEWFWRQVSEPSLIVGFCSNTFDLPFLWRRSKILGIAIPTWLREGRYWNNLCVDIRELWGLGDRQPEGTLDQLFAAFGLPPKLGSGKNFAALLTSDPDAAVAYLNRDVEGTEQVYLKLR